MVMAIWRRGSYSGRLPKQRQRLRPVAEVFGKFRGFKVPVPLIALIERVCRPA